MQTNPILAVDARNIYRTDRRGTGKNLIDLYRRVARLRPTWRFFMFYQLDCSDDPFADLPNVCRRRIDIKGDRFDLWQHVRLPLATKLAGADLLHCPANTAPYHPAAPMVVTIHDLICLDGRWRESGSQAWERNIAHAAETASKIITPSRFTKRQIVDRFRVPADNITVNYWAADGGCKAVRDKAELNRVRNRYGLGSDRPYVLAFGSGDRRKNTARIIEAWARIPVAVRSRHVLLVVGLDTVAANRFSRQAEQLNVGSTCFLHGFVPEDDLSALISGATVMCYPSLSEGFGLPILDAFVCETAVLTGTTSSLPEVAGAAAVMVDPENEEAIAEGLTVLLQDKARRAELVTLGLAQVKRFTWQACAERACGVFEQVLGVRA